MKSLESIKKDYPELHQFIQVNKNTAWLEWEKFLSEGDKSDLTNITHILQKNNADSAMIADQFKMSLFEWNYIFKHTPVIIDLLIADMYDLQYGLQLLLNWSRELNLFKRRVHDIKPSAESEIVINLWRNPLLLQFFLVMCKDAECRQKLLANNKSALLELIKIKDENPGLFNKLLHSMAENKTVDEASLAQLKPEIRELMRS